MIKKHTVALYTRWARTQTRTRVLAGAVMLIASTILLQTSAPYIESLKTPATLANLTTNPTQLSDTDRALYTQSFAAEDSGDTAQADAIEAQLTNKTLMGYLLATRYLGTHYTPKADELNAWMQAYADHPQAAAISRLASARGAKDVPEVETDKPLKGEGYADNLGRSTMPDGWYRGLALWREEKYSEALPLFAAVGDTESLSDWHRAAGYYWAYRASSHLDQKLDTDKYLAKAADFPATFYGLLAAQHFEAPTLKAEAPAVSRDLRQSPGFTRAALLAQLDLTREAEDELRRLYNSVEPGDRAGIITLAHELNLPNLQVRLSHLPNLTTAQALYASYPTPQFILDAQKDVNPALLLSIARTESGFRDTAANPSGARGMMQMLPSTAHAVERRVGMAALDVASIGDDSTVIERLNDPATSVRYGAQYLKILSREPVVNNSLIHGLASYNAGSGSVMAWGSAARSVADPLLYIESIPFTETRNYVQQVIGQYWVYQLLLKQQPTSLNDMAQGKFPSML